MKQITVLVNKVATTPDSIEFSEVMECIEQCYEFSPCAFSCGKADSAIGTNEGSLKIFAFAKLNNLSSAETLALFGQYYRVDVLENPDGEDHANIRNFIQHGPESVCFEGEPLALK